MTSCLFVCRWFFTSPPQPISKIELNLLASWLVRISKLVRLPWQPVADPEGAHGVRSNPLPAPRFNILWKWNNLVSRRPNYYFLMGYLRKWDKIRKTNPTVYTHEPPFKKSRIRPWQQSRNSLNAEPYVKLNQNLMGGIGATWRFGIAKAVPFQSLRSLPWQSPWNSSNNISWNFCRIEPNPCRSHEGNIMIQIC